MNYPANHAEIAAILNPLVQTLHDGVEGYRTATAETQTPHLREAFAQLAVERAEMVATLQMCVRDHLGEHYELGSSPAAAAHRGWMDLKAALTSLDDGPVLAECERGEDFAIEQFRAALESGQLTGEFHALVARQAVALRDALQRILLLQGQNAPVEPPVGSAG